MSVHSEKRFAVLIDAENISSKYIKFILDEISNEGEATYKRIYGDWTQPSLAPWKKVLLEYSVMPVQQYSYTQGKNSSDSAMIIDAMDILYSGRVEGFCLCTSDSDFTRLAVRLRESGMTVVGMGEQKTPKAFSSACNKFKYLDLLSQAAKPQSKSSKNKAAADKQEKADKALKQEKDRAKEKNPTVKVVKEKDKNQPKLKAPKKEDKMLLLPDPETESREKEQAAIQAAAFEKQKAAAEVPAVDTYQNEEEPPEGEVTSLEEIKQALLSIINEEGDEDGWVSTSDLGNKLLKRYSDFDVRNYGFTKLTPFLKSLRGFEMMSIRNKENSNIKLVFLREYLPDRDSTND
ncbi:MAG: NYN domain-containing protein [Firmicutes bacterium]|nr:NYN domain-containing protein [Bacillota bacterium]